MQFSKPAWREVLAALVTGVLLTLAFPLQFWSFAVPSSWQGYTAWVAYAPLLLVSAGASAKRFGLLTALSSLVYFAATIFWVVVAMVEYGNIPLILALGVLLLLAGILSAFHFVGGYAAMWLSRRSRVSLTWIFPVALTIAELARNYAFTGFPWSNVAYSQSRFITLIQCSDLTGLYGLTWMVAAMGAGIGHLALTRGQGEKPLPRLLPLAVAMTSLLLALGYGHWRIERIEAREAASPRYKVALLQGNIPQDEKWQAEKASTILDTYRSLTSRVLPEKPDVVVWPEASVPEVWPATMTELPPIAFPDEGPGTLHIIGVPTYLPQPQASSSATGAGAAASEEASLVMFNSAFMVDERRKVLGRYDKSHLVPFGEYVPLKSLFFFLGPIVQAVGAFQPGTSVLPLKDPRQGGHKIGILICYEDIFPEIARSMGRGGAELLVNVTNDAWYGPTSALQQHLDMAVFRAIENRTWVARAANTGISAFVSSTGRVVTQTRPWEEATLVLDVPLTVAASPYNDFGDLFAYALLALLLFLCVYRR